MLRPGRREIKQGNEIHPPQTEFWGNEVKQLQQSDFEDWGLVREAEPAEPWRRAEPGIQQLSPRCHGVPGVQLQAFSRSCISSQANFQDTASRLTALADTHIMMPMNSTDQNRMAKERQTNHQDLMEHLL